MLLMLLSWQEPLFISKTSYIYFRHDVNISQQDRESTQWFSVSWDLEKSETVWIKWPWLCGQHPHSRHCLSSPAWGSSGVEWLYGRKEGSLGKNLTAQQVLSIAESQWCVLHNWQVGKGGLHKVVSLANTKHSLERAEIAVNQDWYAQLCLCAGCRPTGLTGAQSHEGQRTAKSNTTPQLPQDKRGASQSWQQSAGASWGCGGDHKMMPACRSTTNST